MTPDAADGESEQRRCHGTTTVAQNATPGFLRSVIGILKRARCGYGGDWGCVLPPLFWSLYAHFTDDNRIVTYT
jgi:hypothetical protein